MTTSFNLIREPFIPCILASGKIEEFGILQTLENAKEILEIRADSPPATVCLLRLLLAILHRSFTGPTDEDKWSDLWTNGFAFSQIQSYLEVWKDRFDLFDDHFPFFQVQNPDTPNESRINKFQLGVSFGNNPTLFDHSTDEIPTPLTPGQAARCLLVFQQFGLGGLSGLKGRPYTDGPLARHAHLIPLGQNLFETLMLNLVYYDPNEADPIPATKDDCPSWERDNQATGERPQGYLDYLTWQGRQIRLVPEVSSNGAVVVSRYKIAPGRKLVDGTPPFFPGLVYRGSKNEGDSEMSYSILRFSEHKALWRDSLALFESAASTVGRQRRRDGFNFLAELVANKKVLHPKLKYAVCGLCTESGQQRVYFWRQEDMPLSASFLTDNGLVSFLAEALKLAEKVGRILQVAVYRVVLQIEKALKNTSDEESESAFDFTLKNEKSPRRRQDRVGDQVKSFAPDRLYWSRLEEPFRRFVVALPGSAEHQKREVADWFLKTLRPVALSAFHETVGQLDNSARVLRAVVEGEGQLWKSLGRISKDPRSNALLKKELPHE